MKSVLCVGIFSLSLIQGAGYYEFDFYSNKPEANQLEVQAVLSQVNPNIDVFRTAHYEEVISAVKRYARTNEVADVFELYVRTVVYIQEYRKTMDLHLDEDPSF